MSGNIIAGFLNGIVLIMIVLLLIFLLRNSEKRAGMGNSAIAGKKDDLTAIEGIGPKIAAILWKEGVQSYNALAEMEADRRVETLKRFRLSMADPSTWPQQAELLANGKMKELEELQQKLRGGRQD